MRTDCIRHPAQHPMIVVRRWQIEACDNDVCAAALLSYFEYWHGVKLAHRGQAEHTNTVAQNHGDNPTQDTSLVQWHDEADLEAGIMIYKRNTIGKSLAILYKKGFVQRVPNPNPRYKFDRTRYFLFHPEIVQAWLDEHYPPKVEDASSKNGGRSPNNGAPSPENEDASSKSADCTTNKSTPQASSFDSSTGDADESSTSSAEIDAIAEGLTKLRMPLNEARRRAQESPELARRAIRVFNSIDKSKLDSLLASVRSFFKEPDKWSVPESENHTNGHAPKIDAAKLDAAIAREETRIYESLPAKLRSEIDKEVERGADFSAVMERRFTIKASVMQWEEVRAK